MADHTNYFQHPAGIDVEDESALAAAARAEVAADSAEASATQAATSATESNTWKDLSKAWAIQLGTMVDEGAGPVDWSSKHYATVVAAGEATNAAASAASADALLKAFEQTYLGSKAADPLVDNEGNALITGAVYFNTTTGILRLYNGTSWQDWDPVDLIIADWAAATNYTLGTAVIGTDGVLYVAGETHISDATDFATDLLAGKWRDVHPTSAGYITLTQFSSDGIYWRDQYQTGDTYARTREYLIGSGQNTWPVLLSQITSPHQRSGFCGHTIDGAGEYTLSRRKWTPTGSGSAAAAYTNIGARRRKLYFELTLEGTPNTFDYINWPGISMKPGLETGIDWALVATTTQYTVKSGFTSLAGGTVEYNSGVAPVSGDRIMIAIDCQGRKLWFGVNGTWLGTGAQDPGAELGGFDLEADFAQYGATCIAHRYTISAPTTTPAVEIPSDLLYVPPYGFGLTGNPTLSGFLSVESDDNRIDDVALILNFDIEDGYSADDVHENPDAWWSFFTDKSLYDYPALNYLNRAYRAKPPQDVDTTPSGGKPFIGAYHDDRPYQCFVLGEKFAIDAGEDFTLEWVYKNDTGGFVQTSLVGQIGGTGQTNGWVQTENNTLAAFVRNAFSTNDQGGVRIYKVADAGGSQTQLGDFEGNNPGDGDGWHYSWNHMVVQREGNTISAYQNGRLLGSIDSGTDARVAEPIGWSEANQQGCTLFALITGSLPLGTSYFDGLMDQMRLTVNGARYPAGAGLPSSAPTERWSKPIVDIVDESAWRVYRIGSSSQSASKQLKVEFSSGNGEWHDGYQSGDSIARLLEIEPGESGTNVQAVSYGRSVNAAWSDNKIVVNGGTSWRNFYSDQLFTTGNAYFEIIPRITAVNYGASWGFIGDTGEVYGSGLFPATYGGLTWGYGGTVTGEVPLFGTDIAAYRPGDVLMLAVDFDRRHVWMGHNGHWLFGDPLDYTSGFGFTEKQALATGYRLCGESFGNWTASGGALDWPGTWDGTLWEVPKTPVYEVPQGFQAYAATATQTQPTGGVTRQLASWPVGPAKVGTTLEFSSDGATWASTYTEGDTYIRIQSEGSGSQGSGSYWSAERSYWNDGIFENATASGGGLLLTSDGEYTSGKHYWEVKFERTAPQDPFTSTDVAQVLPDYQGYATWFGDTVGCAIGLIGPETGLVDPDQIPLSGGTTTKQFTAQLYTLKSRLTYHFLNRRDYYKKNGTLTAGFGMQYEGSSRIGTTDYAPIKFGQTWGLAADITAGKYWLIDGAGAVIPSGDPATGTGGFTIPSAVGYSFAVDAVLNTFQGDKVSLRSTTAHGVPSGFTFHAAQTIGTAPASFSDTTLYLPYDTDDQDESSTGATMTSVGTGARVTGVVGSVGDGCFDNGGTNGNQANTQRTPIGAGVTDYNIPANTPFSLKVRFFPRSDRTWPTNSGWFLSNGTGNYNDATNGFGCRITSSNLQFTLHMLAGQPFVNRALGFAFDEWNELLIERDGSDVMRLYGNGTYNTKVTNGSAVTVGGLWVGAAPNGLTAGTYGDFNGYLDEVIWIPDATANPTPFAGGSESGYTVNSSIRYDQTVATPSSRYKVWRMGGAVQLFGTAAPTAGDGKVGDVFTDTTNKNVYQKTAASTWTLRYTYT